MASLFEVDETGQIIYEPSEVLDGSASTELGEVAADPEQNETESEDLSGINTGTYVDSGTDISDSLQAEEILEKTQEVEQIIHGGDTYNVSLLSDEIQELLVNALSPASGTLSSSTIDYFDRIVSGLPSDYVYIAYRTDTQSNYNGVLYFSDNYDLEDNKVTFGEDTKEIRVIRSNYGGVNNVVQYYESEIDGASIGYDLDGDILYYTNAEVGYPILGGFSKPFDYAPLIAIGLLCVMALAILQKIFLKR